MTCYISESNVSFDFSAVVWMDCSVVFVSFVVTVNHGSWLAFCIPLMLYGNLMVGSLERGPRFFSSFGCKSCPTIVIKILVLLISLFSVTFLYQCKIESILISMKAKLLLEPSFLRGHASTPVVTDKSDGKL